MSSSGSVRFHDATALASGLKRILRELEERIELDRPLVLFLAGGMAVHLYTGRRVTTDIDAEFGARIAVPGDLVLELVLEDGSEQVLYFDTNYNPMFGLMHEDYQQDAIELRVKLKHIRVFVLSPLDLAVSKLARFADNDREDIESLVRSGLVGADRLEARATEASKGFVGGLSMIRHNIREAVASARRIEASGADDPS